MESVERDPNVDDRCPLCERPIPGDADASDYCDACGCLLVAWSARDGADDGLPRGVARGDAKALREGDVGGPYRAPTEQAGLDILVEHRQRQLPVAATFAAFFMLTMVIRVDLPAPMFGGLAALAASGIAWGLIPRRAVMRFVATRDGLTVVGEGVPLHHGQRFAAADVAGVYVRALARAERPEDRPLELVLLDRRGNRRSLLRGLDDATTLSWISTHLEQALGFEELPEPR